MRLEPYIFKRKKYIRETRKSKLKRHKTVILLALQCAILNGEKLE